MNYVSVEVYDINEVSTFGSLISSTLKLNVVILSLNEYMLNKSNSLYF